MVFSNRYFRWCGYFTVPLLWFVTTDEFSVRITKIKSRIGASWTHKLLSFSDLSLTHEMAILSKGRKPNNFESHNSLKLSFTIIKGLQSNFLNVIFPWIKLSWYSCSFCDKFGRLNWIRQFLCEGLSSFNLKGFCYSYAWSCSLCEERTSVFHGTYL